MSKKDDLKKLEADIAKLDTGAVEAPAIDSNDGILDDKALQEVSREAELEEKYGDAPIQTFGEAAASGATFGISDQVLTKLKLTTPEALRERRERNEMSAIAGEVTGVVAPLITSGGTSLLARTVGKAGLAVKGASKAGLIAEKVATKSLEKIIKDTGKAKFAREIIKKSIPKTAGSAVEGAFYGAGHLISEDALERAELNAENLISSVGAGALLGGVAGGVFGTAEALVPIIKNNKIVDFASRKFKTNIDDKVAAAKLSGMTPSKLGKIKETRADIYENMPNFYRNNLKLKATDSSEKLYVKSKQAITDLGEDIGKTLDDIDSSVTGINALPAKAEVAGRIQDNLTSFVKEFDGLPSSAAKRNLSKVRREIKQWDDWAQSSERLTGKEMHQLKVKLQKLAKWERKFDSVSLDEKMARSTSEAVRQELMKLADNVSTTDNTLGARLRQQNLDYGTALEITSGLKRKVDKDAAKEFIGLKDALLLDVTLDAAGGGFGLPTTVLATKKFLQSDFRRKLSILAAVEKRNQQVKQKIGSSISNFLKGTGKVAAPASTKIILKSSLSLPNKEKGDKKPKSKLEAFKQISKNLERIKQDPDILLNNVLKQTTRLQKVAPKTSLAVEDSMFKAVTFLENKLPKNPNATSLFSLIKDKWQPSDSDMAKFERYLEVVEDPLAILDDLESGSISREGGEALRAVYPELFAEIQAKIMGEIAGGDLEITYPQRLQLGLVFDIPTDASLIPANIAGLQQNFIDEEESAQNEDGLSQTGLAGLNFAESEATNSQKIATRKS